MDFLAPVVKKLGLRLALSLWLLLGSNAQAIQIRCVDHVKSGILGGELGYGAEVNTAHYSPYSRLLFLSDGFGARFGIADGRSFEGALSLGQIVSRSFPEKHVVSGDFITEGQTQTGNYQQRHVDNSQPLPFADNQFQFVGMRKGLCLCCRHQPCGGFSSKHEATKAFFSEVIRVLDLNDPKSLAVLHGQEFSNPKVVERWKRVAEELEQQYPVRFIFGLAPEGWGFHHGEHGPFA
ncbi:MAG: hypothetical protein KDD43_11710, partial [Bdellovibrionales bacterium]|nr:hypothetical protein [Bdellovibrionales bacterium]